MEIGWPQGIVLGIMLLGLGIDLQRHGSPRSGTHSVIVTLVGNSITLGLLWWGGFFA